MNKFDDDETDSTPIYDKFITADGKVISLDVTDDHWRIGKNHIGNTYELGDTVYYTRDGIYLGDTGDGFGRVVVFENKYIASCHEKHMTEEELDNVYDTVLNSHKNHQRRNRR